MKKIPKYPKEPIPKDYNCWAWNVITGEVFPALFVFSEFLPEDEDIERYGDPEDWVVLDDHCNYKNFLIFLLLLTILIAYLLTGDDHGPFLQISRAFGNL